MLRKMCYTVLLKKENCGLKVSHCTKMEWGWGKTTTAYKVAASLTYYKKKKSVN